MPYPALPDRRMPWDNDGTLVYEGTMDAGATTVLTDALKLALQDESDVDEYGSAGQYHTYNHAALWFFYPEQREITGIYARMSDGGGLNANVAITDMQGSNDTTNGLDGTWETASLPSGVPPRTNAFSWRADIKPVSFTGPKKNLRVRNNGTGGNYKQWMICHLYGEAAAGQMAHDLIYIDQDAGTPAEFTAPEDFGDQPLGTTVVRQFRVKNTSASRTATNINIQCNDADFAISTDGVTWVVTINIASLGPGVESNTMYVRCTTPAPGAALKPRFARIVTVCDAGFFG